MTSGFHVDPDALHEAETGVRDAIAALGSIGSDASQAGEGFGLYKGALNHADDLGYPPLAAALVEFAQRWEQDTQGGLRRLVKDGHTAADGLGQAHKTYISADSRATNQLTTILHDLGLG